MRRKLIKLPADVHSIDFELEYGTATIEVHKDSLDENDNVLIIDDLIATGGTALACADLIHENFDVAKKDILILISYSGQTNELKYARIVTCSTSKCLATKRHTRKHIHQTI